MKGNRYEKNDLDTDLAWSPYGEQHSAQSTPTLDMPVPTPFSPTMPWIHDGVTPLIQKHFLKSEDNIKSKRPEGRTADDIMIANYRWSAGWWSNRLIKQTGKIKPTGKTPITNTQLKERDGNIYEKQEGCHLGYVFHCCNNHDRNRLTSMQRTIMLTKQRTKYPRGAS